MSETITAKVDVDIELECGECGRTLVGTFYAGENQGDDNPLIHVAPCKYCLESLTDDMAEKFDELNSTIAELEEKIERYEDLLNIAANI